MKKINIVYLKGIKIMRIIKEGKIPITTKIFTCHKCGTIFEAEKGEYEPGGQIAYLHDGVTAYCDCPFCGQKTYTYK